MLISSAVHRNVSSFWVTSTLQSSVGGPALSAAMPISLHATDLLHAHLSALQARQSDRLERSESLSADLTTTLRFRFDALPFVPLT